MNKEKERKIECKNADCGFTKERCLIFHGKECVKLGGKRIPLQSATANESVPLKVEAQTTFKPYFIVDGKAIMDEWLEEF